MERSTELRKGLLNMRFVAFNNTVGTGVLCDIAVATRINVNLRDEADTLRQGTPSLTVPFNVDGGVGKDVIATARWERCHPRRPRRRRDHIAGDGNDTVFGEAGNDKINIALDLSRDTADIDNTDFASDCESVT